MAVAVVVLHPEQEFMAEETAQLPETQEAVLPTLVVVEAELLVQVLRGQVALVS